MIAVVAGVVHPVSGGWHIAKPIEASFSDGKWAIIVMQSQRRNRGD
jgi:hypothetical protein